MSPRELTPAQKDRVAGVLLGTAIGDALGVPYEFVEPLLAEEETPVMKGGGLGPYEPGEYSDDTQMAVCVANACALHWLRREPHRTLDAIAANFLHWSRDGATDMGNLTHAVLIAAFIASGLPSALCVTAARRVYERDRSSFGNGALMRTAPVGLIGLGSARVRPGRAVVARAARAIAALTHADPRAGDACVLWSEAVRIAVLEGRFEVTAGLDLIPGERDSCGDEQQSATPRAWWAGVIDEADAADWRFYRGKTNGATHKSLKVAWACIHSTQAGGDGALGDGAGHIRRALEACVHVGHDTDTVAAIAGGLLGARYGASAFPDEWVQAVHGWSGLPDLREYTAADLASLGLLVARAGADASECATLRDALMDAGA